MRARALLVMLAAALCGCPEDVTAPVPDAAVPCESREACNEGRTCGALSECVAGYCSLGQTIVVPCAR